MEESDSFGWDFIGMRLSEREKELKSKSNRARVVTKEQQTSVTVIGKTRQRLQILVPSFSEVQGDKVEPNP